MTLMMQEINSQPVVLKKVLKLNLEKVIRLCSEIKARNIQFMYIAARGTSDHAAVYAKYLIETYTGIPVAFAAPSVITIYNGKLKLKNAMVIGISQSGKAEDVLEVIKHAKSQGSLTTCITNYEESPMALACDYHFNCHAGEEKSVAATKTFTAQMMVMAMIAAKLSKDDALLKQLYKVPFKVEEFLKKFSVSDEIISEYIKMDECFVLSRGKNYAIALEGALKIQETCYVRAKAYAVSDFYHGPMALLDITIPVFVIAPKSITSGDTRAMMKTLAGYGIKTLAVTNDPEIVESSSKVIRIPDGIEGISSPFITAAAMQVFACKLSLAKGLNPDSPRNIKKVTITR